MGLRQLLQGRLRQAVQATHIVRSSRRALPCPPFLETTIKLQPQARCRRLQLPVIHSRAGVPSEQARLNSPVQLQLPSRLRPFSERLLVARAAASLDKPHQVGAPAPTPSQMQQSRPPISSHGAAPQLSHPQALPRPPHLAFLARLPQGSSLLLEVCQRRLPQQRHPASPLRAVPLTIRLHLRPPPCPHLRPPQQMQDRHCFPLSPRLLARTLLQAWEGLVRRHLSPALQRQLLVLRPRRQALRQRQRRLVAFFPLPHKTLTRPPHPRPPTNRPLLQLRRQPAALLAERQAGRQAALQAAVTATSPALLAPARPTALAEAPVALQPVVLAVVAAVALAVVAVVAVVAVAL